MIRTQLKLFPEETKKGQMTKTTIISQSSSLHLKDGDPIVDYLGDNFSTSDRRYYAGMIDGDGCLSLRLTKKNTPVFTVSLNLRHDHAEPVLKLAEMFDLTISKKIYLIPQGNAQPSLKIQIGGLKAKLFLFSIYQVKLWVLFLKKAKSSDFRGSSAGPELDFLI